MVIGFEREVFRRSSVEVTYVDKVSSHDIYSTCSGNYPEPTIDHDCDFWVFANLPDTSYEYQGLLMRFETRALDNLHLLASWVISDSKGSMAYNRTGGTIDFDYYPYHYVNRFGHLPDHSRHRVKLNGFWLLPYDFSLAFDGWWQSEFRYTPYDPSVPGMPSGVQFVEPVKGKLKCAAPCTNSIFRSPRVQGRPNAPGLRWRGLSTSTTPQMRRQTRTAAA